ESSIRLCSEGPFTVLNSFSSDAEQKSSNAELSRRSVWGKDSSQQIYSSEQLLISTDSCIILKSEKGSRSPVVNHKPAKDK
ncbi:MAG: hypothetical protein IKE25_06910, partial [Clostridia bacterium]|nr:hypothetical protein [Clostridia bacterium]